VSKPFPFSFSSSFCSFNKFKNVIMCLANKQCQVSHLLIIFYLQYLKDRTY
jgi:hypothetical protein